MLLFCCITILIRSDNLRLNHQISLKYSVWEAKLHFVLKVFSGHVLKINISQVVKI